MGYGIHIGDDMRISERGQITIPKALRDRYGLNRDVEVEVVPTEKGLLIQKTGSGRAPGGSGCRNSDGRLGRGRVHRGNPRTLITAVDTNVLLDLMNFRSPHHAQSREWLRAAYNQGAVVICDIVYAELVPAFGDRAALDGALREINVGTSPIDTTIAYEAGVRWMRYRRAGGPRTRIVADFSDRGACTGCRRQVPDSGPGVLRVVLRGVEDSAGVVPAGEGGSTCVESVRRVRAVRLEIQVEAALRQRRVCTGWHGCSLRIDYGGESRLWTPGCQRR